MGDLVTLCDITGVTLLRAAELLVAASGNLDNAIGLHFELLVNPDYEQAERPSPRALAQSLDEFDAEAATMILKPMHIQHQGAGALNPATRAIIAKATPHKKEPPKPRPIVYPNEKDLLPIDNTPISPLAASNSNSSLHTLFLRRAYLDGVYFRRNKTVIFDLEENVEKVRFFFRVYQQEDRALAPDFGTHAWLQKHYLDGTMKSTIAPALSRSFGLLHTYGLVLADLKQFYARAASVLLKNMVGGSGLDDSPSHADFYLFALVSRLVFVMENIQTSIGVSQISAKISREFEVLDEFLSTTPVGYLRDDRAFFRYNREKLTHSFDQTFRVFLVAQAYLSQHVHLDIQATIFGFYFSFFTFRHELKLTSPEFKTLKTVCDRPVAFHGLDEEKLATGQGLRGHMFSYLLQGFVLDFLKVASSEDVNRYMFSLEELLYRSFDDLRTITAPRRRVKRNNLASESNSCNNCNNASDGNEKDAEESEDEREPCLQGPQEVELLVFSLALMVMMYQLAVVLLQGRELGDYSVNTTLLRKAIAVLYCDENRYCQNPLLIQRKKQMARGLMEAFLVTARDYHVTHPAETEPKMTEDAFDNVLISGARMTKDEIAALLSEDDTEESVLYSQTHSEGSDMEDSEPVSEEAEIAPADFIGVSLSTAIHNMHRELGIHTVGDDVADGVEGVEAGDEDEAEVVQVMSV